MEWVTMVEEQNNNTEVPVGAVANDVTKKDDLNNIKQKVNTATKQKQVRQTKKSDSITKKSDMSTRLFSSENSSLVIRQYNSPILHFVAISTSDNIDDIDTVVCDFWSKVKQPTSIQEWKKLANELNELIINSYIKTDSSAVIISANKLLLTSLAGDFRVDSQRRLELYSLLNVTANI